MLVGRLAHVAIGVTDVPAATRFYRDLLGVVEVDRTEAGVFLSGGRGAGFDLAIGPWAPGLHHFAFQVAGDEDLREAERRLRDAGTQLSDVDPATEPGVERGLRFVLPSGHLMELVTMRAPSAFVPTPRTDPRHRVGIGPVPLEHITLNCDDVEEVATFLVDNLGFRITESVRPGGRWFNAFLRCRDQHHDLAFFANEQSSGPGLNHFCFAVPSAVDLVHAADIACGLGHELECSPGRHLAGDNVFIYLFDPSGNRIEINTELARIDIAALTRVSEEMRFDAWRDGIPPSMLAACPAHDGRTPAVQRAT